MIEKRKQHIARLPKPTYPSYEITDHSVSVSIPLFYSQTDSGMTEYDEQRMVDIHAKGAIWAAISLIHNTDLSDNGVGIYFHIEDKVWDIVADLFKNVGVPETAVRVMTLDAETPDYIQHPHFGKKFMCLDDSDLNPEHWLIADSDLFVCSKGTKFAWHETLKVFESPSLLRCKPTQYPRQDGLYARWVYGICMGAGVPFDADADLQIQERRALHQLGLLDRQMQLNPDKNPTRPYTATQLMLIPTAHKIVKFIKKHYRQSYQDEFMLAAWQLIHGDISQLKDKLGGVVVYGFESEYINRDTQKDTHGYLAHIIPDNHGKAQTHVDTWYNDFYNALQPKSESIIEKLQQTTSDKEHPYGHRYGKVYDMLLNTIAMKANRVLKVCEIGVSFFGEGSLGAFQDLDIVDEVVGVDVIPYAGELGDKATFHQMDAYSDKTIAMLKAEHGAFDLIIDDGSHKVEDQEFFLKNYGILLSEHGKLVCEDVHDPEFFKRMCHDGAYGIDGWANVGRDTTAGHDERLLIQDADSVASTNGVDSEKRNKIFAKPVESHVHTVHCLGIPYAETSLDFNTCAFVQRVWKSCAMWTDLGYNVYHYGHEASDVPCTEHIPVTDDFILTKAYGSADYKEVPPEQNCEDVAFRMFAFNAERELRKRVKDGDIVLAFSGWGHKDLCMAISDLPAYVVEPSIGYPDAFSQYRVYQSSAKMHFERGKASHAHRIQKAFPDKKEVHITPYNCGSENVPDWNAAVIPNFFYVDDFPFGGRENREDWLLYIGRIVQTKGLEILFEMAEYTDTPVKLAGTGDIDKLGLRVPKQVEFLGIADREMRKDLLQRAKAVVCPSFYIEPFLGFHVEAQLAGCPIITVNFGAPYEYCKHQITGFRCQNMDHFMYALEHIDEIDPVACREHGMQFSMKRAALSYHEYFSMIKRNKTDWWSYDPEREELDWLVKRMTEAEIDQKYTALQMKVQNITDGVIGAIES